MTDCHLRFVVTNPIHVEAMKVRRKARRENYLGSERGRKQTQRVLKQVREHLYNKEQAKNIYFYDLSAIFARKLQKSHLKKGMNIDWGIIILI